MMQKSTIIAVFGKFSSLCSKISEQSKGTETNPVKLVFGTAFEVDGLSLTIQSGGIVNIGWKIITDINEK